MLAQFLLVRGKDYLFENIVSSVKSTISHLMAEFASQGKNIVNFHLKIVRIAEMEKENLDNLFPIIFVLC